MGKQTRPAWVEVNLASIAHNVQYFKKLIHENCQLLAVVKANAYGHGDLAVVRTALSNGATWIGVALPEEGVRLRRAGIAAPILVLGAVGQEQLELCVTKDLACTVFQWSIAQSLSNLAIRYNKTVRVHLKIDTGMGRLGILPSEALRFAIAVSRLPGIQIQGILTHFATADQPEDQYVHWQLEQFEKVIAELSAHHINIPIKHCANTSAVLFLPEAHFDLVRVGIGLYGLHPQGKRSNLHPAMSFKCRIAAARRVPAGSAISYGASYITKKETTIAILPVGYADGVSRRLSNQGEVLIDGNRFPIIGKVCMDHCMVDVGDFPIEIGQEVTLIGRQGNQEITVEDWADWLGTINYEVPCMISERVPRIYT